MADSRTVVHNGKCEYRTHFSAKKQESAKKIDS